MISIRSGGGFGDNIYLQPIVSHLLKKERVIEVVTRKPDIFRPLGDRVRISEFRRKNINILAHYTSRKGIPGTTQFEDMCINARIKEKVPFDLVWDFKDLSYIREIKQRAEGRKIAWVVLPRWPMDRSDKFGQELLPESAPFNLIVDLLNSRGFYTILAGNGEQLYEAPGVKERISRFLTIDEQIHLAQASDLIFGQVGYSLAVAESLSKKSFTLFARKGLKSATKFISDITPEKMMHKKGLSFYGIDDDPKILERVEECL